MLHCGGAGALQLRLHSLRAGRSHCSATYFTEFQCHRLHVVRVCQGQAGHKVFRVIHKLTATSDSTEANIDLTYRMLYDPM